MDYLTPDVVRKMDPRTNINARVASLGDVALGMTLDALNAPKPADATDEFDNPTLTYEESRIARANLVELRDTLGPMSLRFIRGAYTLTVTRRGQKFGISRTTLTGVILAAHELNLGLVTASAASQEAA